MLFYKPNRARKAQKGTRIQESTMSALPKEVTERKYMEGMGFAGLMGPTGAGKILTTIGKWLGRSPKAASFAARSANYAAKSAKIEAQMAAKAASSGPGILKRTSDWIYSGNKLRNSTIGVVGAGTAYLSNKANNSYYDGLESVNKPLDSVQPIITNPSTVDTTGTGLTYAGATPGRAAAETRLAQPELDKIGDVGFVPYSSQRRGVPKALIDSVDTGYLDPGSIIGRPGQITSPYVTLQGEMEKRQAEVDAKTEENKIRAIQRSLQVEDDGIWGKDTEAAYQKAIALQTRLKEGGLYDGEIDGIIGPKSKAAMVKDSQIGVMKAKKAKIKEADTRVIPTKLATSLDGKVVGSAELDPIAASDMRALKKGGIMYNY